jgi:quinol monooxygenase YgiN
MSVVELATLRARAGCGDRMEQALPAALAHIERDSRCLGAVALRCVERDQEFVLRIEWTSVDAHHAFREGPGFAAYRSAVAEWLDQVVDFAHYEELTAEACPATSAVAS